jgi:hypothetical protein
MRLTTHLANLRARRQSATSASIPATVWSAISNTAEIDLLFDECLTFIQAARSRGPDVSPDLSEITDLLFEELAGKMNSTAWRSYSTFSAEDSFDLNTNIVRLRYPLCDIWDLPVTVHEFGHFISPRLGGATTPGGSTPVFQQYKKEFLERERQQEPQNGANARLGLNVIDWMTYLDEMFADAFATYALGPAFACTCIALRFDPLNAQVEADGRHPSYSARAYNIFQMLQRMDKELAQQGQMKDAIRALAQHWRGLCESAKTACLPDDENRKWIEAQVSNIYEMLRSSEPALRFTAWDAATQTQAWLLNPEVQREGEVSIAQLLNTAWILRMIPGCDPQQLNKNFMALCHRKAKQYDQ